MLRLAFASLRSVWAAGLVISAPVKTAAQVLQIGPDGAVAVFAGPTVFTDQGARPLTPNRPAPAPPARAQAVPRRASAEDYRRAAAGAALSVDLVAAVAWQESRGRSGAISARGARGEMQLMPATARALRVDALDGAQNVRGGAQYLSTLMRRYDGDLVRALAAYNAGPAAVDRYGGVPPFRETQDYVAAVLNRLSQVIVPVSMSVTERR